MQSLRQILGRLTKTYNIEKSINQHRAINIWKDIVGKRIAEVSKPTGIKNGKLHVHVNSSTWRNELMFHRERIIQNLNEKLGDGTIQEIVLR